MNEDIVGFFAGGLISNFIPGFPYPQKHCRFCERELEVVKAIHLRDEPTIYKVLYVCDNTDCGAYDFEARSAYCRIYYPSQDAMDALESKEFIYTPRKVK